MPGGKRNSAGMLRWSKLKDQLGVALSSEFRICHHRASREANPLQKLGRTAVSTYGMWRRQ